MASASAENSFVLVAAADEYFAGRLNAEAWESIANDELKDRALIQASRILNLYVKWNDTEDAPAPTFSSSPFEVQAATCELALTLLSGDTQVRDDLEGLSSINLSGLSVSANGKSKKVVPDHVYLMVSHLGARRGSGGSIEIVRSL